MSIADMQETLANIHRMHFLINTLKVEKGLHSVQVARAKDDYFDVDLEERAKFLKAPSAYHLCKTIIMKNSKWALGVEAFPGVENDPTYPKNVIIVSQFKGEIKAQKIQNIMKKYQNENTKTGEKVSTKGFHFYFTEEEDAIALSG